MESLMHLGVDNLECILPGLYNTGSAYLADLVSSGMNFISSMGDFAQVGSSAGGMDNGGDGLVDQMNAWVTVNPLTSDHVLGLSDYLMQYGIKHANKMTGVARALGAVFAIIVAGKEAYKVMAEQRGFDILDILRPILFAFVLAFWGPIVNTVIAPGHAVENHCKQLYLKANLQVDSLRTLRFNKSTNLGTEIREKRAAVQQQQVAQEKSGGLWDTMVSRAQEVLDFLNEIALTAAATLETVVMHFLETIIIWIGELCYTVAAYIIFVLKALFITVLAMFGPLYMAASILPAWKDAWRQWVERMVHASLYGAMGYLAMAFSMQLICYCLEMDIQALQAIIDGSTSAAGGMLTYLKGGLGTVCTTAISYFVGCAAMKAVPEMATMVFPGSHSMGAGQFIGGLQSSAKSGAMMAVTKGMKS